MRRVIEGLNSADPVTRIITFEEAMARGDKNLERYRPSESIYEFRCDPALDSIRDRYVNENNICYGGRDTIQHGPE